MFSSLFTTVLLACTVASTPLKTSVKKDLSYGTSLYGTYCVNNTFNVDGSELYGTFTYFDSSEYDYDLSVSFLDSAVGYVIYTVDSFTIAHFLTGFTVSISARGYGDIDFTIYAGNGIGSLDYLIRELVLFFPNDFSLSADRIELFNCIFNGTGNNYVSSYSGWYTIVTPSYDIDGYIRLNGFYIYENNLYNRLEFSFENMAVYLNYDGAYADARGYIITNGVLQGSANIYFESVMMPTEVRTVVSNKGVFDYVYEPVQYDFGDMIFSVIDAPIYMLSQLFSFELFGIQFYIAFMSIVTVVLICFVIKKII